LSEPSACAGTRKGGSRNVRRRSGPRQRDHFDPPSLSAEREPSRAICGEDESGGANAWAAASRGSQAIRMACVYAPCKRRTTAGQRIAPSRRWRRIVGLAGVRLNTHPQIRHASGTSTRHLSPARHRRSLAGVHVRKIADMNGRASDDRENEPDLHARPPSPPRDDAEETVDVRASTRCADDDVRRPPLVGNSENESPGLAILRINPA
jgi:hypothetical protein